MTKCESCEKEPKEAYRVTVTLCHNCKVDLEEWFERRKGKH